MIQIILAVFLSCLEYFLNKQIIPVLGVLKDFGKCLLFWEVQFCLVDWFHIFYILYSEKENSILPLDFRFKFFATEKFKNN